MCYVNHKVWRYFCWYIWLRTDTSGQLSSSVKIIANWRWYSFRSILWRITELPFIQQAYAQTNIMLYITILCSKLFSPSSSLTAVSYFSIFVFTEKSEDQSSSNNQWDVLIPKKKKSNQQTLKWVFFLQCTTNKLTSQ